MKVPEPTLRRLPWYLAYAKLCEANGCVYLTSTQIAREISMDASLVAKDFSYVNITGKTRVGYEVSVLISALESFLGFSQQHKAFLFGVGSLGSSLLHDNGLEQYGLEVVAGFDVKYELAGTHIGRKPIHHLSHFADLQRQMDVRIGVLTVPVNQAQEVANLMVAGGIKAIWNFTPFRIKVPNDIVVQNTSMYAHLAVMFNRLHDVTNSEEE